MDHLESNPAIKAIQSPLTLLLGQAISSTAELPRHLRAAARCGGSNSSCSFHCTEHPGHGRLWRKSCTSLARNDARTILYRSIVLNLRMGSNAKEVIRDDEQSHFFNIILLKLPLVVLKFRVRVRAILLLTY